MNRHTGGYQGYTGYGTKDEELARMMQKEASAAGVGPEVIGAPNYESMDRESGLYQDMIGRGMDTSSTNFTGGLARLANAYLGRRGLNKLEKREGEAQEYEANAAQAQSDKLKEMARMMAGPDADPQTAAMAEMFPEKFAESRFDMDVNAAKPQAAVKPDYYEVTIMENGKPVQYEMQRGNPGYKRLLGEAQPRSALVNNTIGADGSAPTWDGLPVGGYVGKEVMDLTSTAEWKSGKLPFKSGVAPGSIEWRASDGSTAEQEAATAEAKREGRFADGQRAGATVLREVNRGIGMLDQIYGEESAGGSEADVKPGLGTMAGAAKRIAASKVPGTAEYIFVKNIESALANVGLDRIQEMRDNSPTGGALGQVPVQQQARLEQTIGSLNDLGLPRAYIEENLRYANNAYLDIIYGSPGERAALVGSGVISEEDNDWINDQYDKLGWDDYGNSIFSGNNLQPVVGRTLADGSRVSEADILATMEETGLSRLEVEAKLRERLK